MEQDGLDGLGGKYPREGQGEAPRMLAEGKSFGHEGDLFQLR